MTQGNQQSKAKKAKNIGEIGTTYMTHPNSIVTRDSISRQDMQVI